MATRITPPCHGKTATFFISASAYIIALIGKFKSTVMPMPIIPAENPIISVSALNTRATSFFDAPNARNTPISFILSSTDIYVIIPIIIDETTKDTDTKPIRT